MESQPKLNFNKKYLICDVCGEPKEKVRPIQLSDFHSKIMICEECDSKFYGKLILEQPQQKEIIEKLLNKENKNE